MVRTPCPVVVYTGPVFNWGTPNLFTNALQTSLWVNTSVMPVYHRIQSCPFLPLQRQRKLDKNVGVGAGVPGVALVHRPVGEGGGQRPIEDTNQCKE